MGFDKEREIASLLDILEEIVEEGKPSFMGGGKVAVERDDLLEIIKDIKSKLPTELQQSKWIVEERNKILAEAQGEAKLIIEEANETLNRMIDQHEITKYAEERAQYIIESARKDAREIHRGAQDFAGEKLKQVEQQLKNTLEIIHNESQAFETFVTHIIRELYECRQQVRDMIPEKEEH